MKQFWCTSKTVWWMFRVFSCGAAGNRTLFFLLFGYVLFAFVSISGVVHLPFTVFVRRAEEKKRTQKAAVAKQKTADGGEETPPSKKKTKQKTTGFVSVSDFYDFPAAANLSSPPPSANAFPVLVQLGRTRSFSNEFDERPPHAAERRFRF